MPIEVESPEQLGYTTIRNNLSEGSVSDRRISDLDYPDRRRLSRLVGIAQGSGAGLLVDETYRDLTHGERLPMAASLSARAVSVASMSKAYGLPGLRIGLGGHDRP
jgi:hypothetical protein